MKTAVILPRWNDEEIKIIENYYPLTQKDTILQLLPRRNWRGIVTKARRLGIVGYKKRTCPHCGREFIRPRQSRKKYCSKECAWTFWYNGNKDRVIQKTREWAKKHPDKRRESYTKYYNNLKLSALQKISGQDKPKCVYCGCDDLRLLEINHKFGGGKKEARTRQGGYHLYRLIVKGLRRLLDLEVTCKLCNNRHYVWIKYGKEVDKWRLRWKP